MDELTSLSSANGAWTVIALRTGGPGFFQRLATALFCEQCGQDTRHEVLYVGQRIAEVRCTERGAHLLLQTRTKVLNGNLHDALRYWYPRFRARAA